MPNCGTSPSLPKISVTTARPLAVKLITFTTSGRFCSGCLITRVRRAWNAASKPEAQIWERKPSQNTGTTGMPTSASASFRVASISSPIIPEAQEVVTKITLGWHRS
ncbi:hypothetical protein D3C76_1471580 [compost metagenome]